MRAKLVLLFGLVLAALLPSAAAHAAPHIRPQLVAESAAPAPGQSVALALVMTPDPGWHGYWLNPGDAGVPPAVKWRLPEGVGVGAFRYPVPTTLLIAGLMNYIYEREYALIAPLTVPKDAAPGTRLRIEGDATWLACTDEVCVPEQGRIATELTVGDGRIDPATRARFDGWRAKLPRPLGGQARFEVAQGRVRIAVPLPANVPVSDPYFFPATENAVDYAAPQTVTRNGDALIVETAARGAPKALAGVLRLDGGTGLEVEAVPGPVPAGGEPVGRASGWSWQAALGALGAALLGGLLLNVMPCVFPILSLKALSLARSGESDAAARREALAYTAGVVLACLGLGAALLAIRASGEMVGWAFQLQVPAIVLGLLLLMVAITLNLAGMFEIGGVSVSGRLATADGVQGAFLTGALAAFVATPCTGPFMGAALGAALVVPAPVALGIFAMLGLGLALPFLAVGFIPALRTRLPRPGPWMERFRRLLAIPMALTALALLWVLWRQAGLTGLIIGVLLSLLLAAVLWQLGRRSDRFSFSPATALISFILLSTGVSTLAAGPLNRARLAPAGERLAANSFSEERLAQLRAEGRPVFVYFTADWCLTCTVNEKAAIERAEGADAFARGKVAVLVGDWTNGDPKISRFLEAHGRSGVPLYLFYRPGAAQPEELPQVLTPSRLVGLAS